MYTQLNAHKYTVYRLTYSQCAILPRAVAATTNNVAILFLLRTNFFSGFYPTVDHSLEAWHYISVSQTRVTSQRLDKHLDTSCVNSASRHTAFA